MWLWLLLSCGAAYYFIHLYFKKDKYLPCDSLYVNEREKPIKEEKVYKRKGKVRI